MTDRSWLSVTTATNTHDVRALQESLRELGHLSLIDGRFGIGTQRAVVAFQNEKHLAADGNVGPVTWEALDKASHPTAPKPKAKAAEKAAEPEAAEPEAVKPAAKKAPAKKAPAKKPAAKKSVTT
jgi:hypothetical protein